MSGLHAVNVNDSVWVKLTPAGKEIYAASWRAAAFSKLPPPVLQPDAEGRVRFQLHELMYLFGSEMVLGNWKLPFVDNQIWFEVKP